jgi:hypothetical protein
MEPRPTSYISVHNKEAAGVAHKRRNQTLDNREVERDGDTADHRSPKTAAPNRFWVTFFSACVLGAHAAGVAAAAIAALRPQFLNFGVRNDVLSYYGNAGQHDKHCAHGDPDVYRDPNDVVNISTG